MIKSLISRNGKVGRRFIWSSYSKRNTYLQFKRFLNRKELKSRERIASNFKMELDALKSGFASLSSNENKFFNSNEAMSLLSASIESAHLRLNETKVRKAQLLTNNLDFQNKKLFNSLISKIFTDDFLKLVSSYLGVVPVVNMMDIWVSRYTETQKHNSQNFHFDWEDAHQLKLFLFLSDVDEDCGPFSILDSTTSAHIRDEINFSFSDDYYSDDQAILKSIEKDSTLVKVTGKKGTIAFADTSACLHYGSRINKPGNTRTLLMIQFLRPQAFEFNWKFQEEAKYKNLISPDMTRLQKLVLGQTINELR